MPDIFISEGQKKEKPKIDKVIEKESKEDPSFLGMKRGEYNPLSSFGLFPKRVNFEIKETKEEIVLLLRQHPIVNLKWMFPAFFMAIAPVVLKYFPLLSFLPQNFQFVVIMGWYMMTFAFCLQGFLHWYFNVYFVTDERIIDVDFNNLVYKEVSDANIDKIQDVTYKMGGVIRTMFNYGDVMIQTASEVPNFIFEAVPKPDKVAKILQEMRIEEAREAIEGRIR